MTSSHTHIAMRLPRYGYKTYEWKAYLVVTDGGHGGTACNDDIGRERRDRNQWLPAVLQN